MRQASIDNDNNNSCNTTTIPVTTQPQRHTRQLQQQSQWLLYERLLTLCHVKHFSILIESMNKQIERQTIRMDSINEERKRRMDGWMDGWIKNIYPNRTCINLKKSTKVLKCIPVYLILPTYEWEQTIYVSKV